MILQASATAVKMMLVMGCEITSLGSMETFDLEEKTFVTARSLLPNEN